jgi:hypothetical protein
VPSAAAAAVAPTAVPEYVAGAACQLTPPEHSCGIWMHILLVSRQVHRDCDHLLRATLDQRKAVPSNVLSLRAGWRIGAQINCTRAA